MASDAVHQNAISGVFAVRMPGEWPNGELGNLKLLEDIGKDSLNLAKESTETTRSVIDLLKDKSRKVASSALNHISEISGINKLKEEALQDMKRSPEKLPPRSNFAQSVAQGIAENPQKIMKAACQPKYHEAFHVLTEERQELVRKVCSSKDFINGDMNRKMALLLGLSGAGPTKMCQIAASDESLDPKIREILGQLKSSGMPTRDVSETQKMVDGLYGVGKYKIKSSAGVGSIGEVYLAETREGGTVIIKILKKGLSEKSLQAEWEIMKGLVSSAYKDEAKSKYQCHTVDNLYKGWIEELDFGAEAKNADALAKGATRYKVAKTLELGYEKHPVTGEMKYPYPTSMVQEAAEGISLDELTKMLKVYNESPQAYHEQFRGKFDKCPWLENPREWMTELAPLYLNSFNEQTLLRSKKGNLVASHGDPHGGNVFINHNQASGQLEATYIDAGLVALRDSKKAASHLGLLVNSMLGNSEALARSIVDNADKLPDRPKEEIIQEIKEVLDLKLFKARVNLTDAKYNNTLFDSLMEEKGIFIPESETAFFKSQMQALMNYEEISKLTNQVHNNYLLDSLPDIAKGAAMLIWQEPIEAGRHLAPSIPHLWFEGKTALRNACQFFIRHAA